MSKTAVYNVRLDIRAVATLHKYYTAKGFKFDSVSTLNRTLIEYLSETVVRQHSAEPFLDVTSAVNYLEHLNLMKPLRSRGGRSIIKEMQKESLDLDGISPDYINRKSVVSDDQVARAKEILGQREEKSTSGAILGVKPGTIKED